MFAKNLFSPRRCRPLLLAAGLGLLALAAASPAEAKGPKGGGGPAAYTIVPLGLPDAYWGGSRASAINDDGWVTGVSGNNSGAEIIFLVVPLDTDGDGRPDTWFQDADGDGGNDLMLEIALRGGGSVPLINNLGQIVGFRYVGGQSKPFLWDPLTGFQDIDLLPGYTSIYIRAVNDLGQVVGQIKFADTGYEAFLWDPGFGTMPLGLANWSDSDAWDINNRGQVVGEFRAEGGKTHAFLWDPDHGMLDLFPGDRVSRANGINEAGSVVGFLGDLAPTYGFVWDDLNGDLVADPFEVTALANPNNLKTEPLEINDAGQVVGGYQLEEYRTAGHSGHGDIWHACLWNADGTILDLYSQSAGPSGEGWRLDEQFLRDVNRDGLIPVVARQDLGHDYLPEQAAVLVPNN